ncbi:integral membrane protein [Streptococcus infantis SK1302]|uniref:Integral membrane protein n=1 Tax=Streptococcus infantis SK1302 TaxID=871237 RepID=A0ABN0B3D9_9STRE|nr:integral membrane protein [Streptococcus infantis SK1302]
MSEITHEIDSNFAGRLNILRAGVLGANDGIISIAGVVIGVASATSNIWIIFLSGLAAILAGAFSMAGGEYVSVSTQKDTEEAAVAREQLLLDKDLDAAKKSLYAAYLQNGECETSAQLLTNKAFLKIHSRLWLRKNTESSTKNLLILGMLLFLASSLLFLVVYHQCFPLQSFQVTTESLLLFLSLRFLY